MKLMYPAVIVLALLAQPATASQQSLHHLIQTKCEIEFDKHTAKIKADYYTPLVLKYAKRHGLPPEIVAAVVWHESNYRPLCHSECGALGLMQIVPYAGRFPRGANPYDPEVNLNTGCRLLKGYLLEFHGDWRQALTAYNHGDTTVSRGMSRSSYSHAVLHTAGR